MTRGGWIALLIGIAVAVAGTVGWRGSRPVSPIADAHADRVRVVPATGTLARNEAIASLPAAAPTSVAPTEPLDLSGQRELATRFAAEQRDVAWAPAAEASLQAAYASVPALSAPPTISCAVTLCRLAATIAPEATSEQVDQAMAALQSAPMPAAFRDQSMAFATTPDRRRSVTGWFVRR